jgi:hypothetical protein
VNLDSTLTAAIRTAGQLGVTLPGDFTADWVRLTGLHDQADTTPDRASLADAFAAAFDAGKDPTVDKAVTAARKPPEKLAPLGPAMQAFAARLRDRHAAGIVAAFAPVVDEAAAAMAHVFTTSGAFPLDSDHRQAEHVRPHNDRIEAVRRVIVRFTTNSRAPGFAGRTVNAAHWIAEPDADLWWRNGLDASATSDGRSATAWSLLALGYRLSLATPTTVHERAAITAAGKDEVLEAVQRERSALGTSLGAYPAYAARTGV